MLGITPSSFQIPFFKDCGEDNECVTDLVLRATMDIMGSRYGVALGWPGAEPCAGSPRSRNRPRRCRQSPHVLRKGRRKVVVDVVLENKEENAYNASLLLRFSSNLHFSSLALQVRGRGEGGGSPRPVWDPPQPLQAIVVLPALCSPSSPSQEKAWGRSGLI